MSNRPISYNPTWGHSDYRGVTFRRDLTEKVWWVRVNGKSAGFYEDEVEAAQAYDREAFRLFGEAAKLNFSPLEPKGLLEQARTRNFELSEANRRAGKDMSYMRRENEQLSVLVGELETRLERANETIDGLMTRNAQLRSKSGFHGIYMAMKQHMSELAA